MYLRVLAEVHVFGWNYTKDDYSLCREVWFSLDSLHSGLEALFVWERKADCTHGMCGGGGVGLSWGNGGGLLCLRCTAVYRRRPLIEGRVMRDLGRQLTIKDHETALLFSSGGLLPLGLWMMSLCFRSGKFCDAEEPERDSEEGREEWPLRASLEPCVEIWKFDAFQESSPRLGIWNSPYSESLNGHYRTVAFIYLFIFCICS